MVKFIVRIFFLQPFKVLPFLSWKRQVWPNEFVREYYLSFEDALWNLLPRLGYKRGSKILVPTFYCLDVIENMKAHGYIVDEYPIDSDFSIDESVVNSIIQEIKPDIFIDFETNGIPTHISERISRKLPFHALIVHDKVHSLISPTIENFPISEKHLILTSTRKVSPFPGSMAIYSRNARKSIAKLPLRYTIKALSLWIFYLLLLQFAYYLRSRWFAVTAETIIKRHNDLIGDYTNSAPLPAMILSLIDRIDFAKVEASKQLQFEVYLKKFKAIIDESSEIWLMDNAVTHQKLQRGFPIIVSATYSQKFIDNCRDSGLIITSQSDDLTWSKKQELILLPLGPHLSVKDIELIAEIALKALTNALQYDTITA